MQVVMSDIAVTVAVVRSAQAQAQAQVLAARLSTAVNKALARNGGWLQRQTLSSPRNRRATSAHRVRRCNAQQLQRRTAVDGGRPTGGSWSWPQRTVPPLQRAARGVQFWCECEEAVAQCCCGCPRQLVAAITQTHQRARLSTRYFHTVVVQVD